VRVQAGRARQRDRIAEAGLMCNPEKDPRQVRKFCPLDETGRSIIRQAMAQLQLSKRAFDWLLKRPAPSPIWRGRSGSFPNAWRKV